MKIPYKAQKIITPEGGLPQEDKTWKARTGTVEAPSTHEAVKLIKTGKLDPIGDKHLAIRSVHSGSAGIIIYYYSVAPTVKKPKPTPRRRAPRSER